MISHKLNKLPKNTFEIELSIPWEDLRKEYDAALEQLTTEVEIEGYRKGKAPKSVVEKKLAKDSIYQRAIQNLLPRAYEEIVKKEDLKPIINPKVELVKAKENDDWQAKITLAQRPQIQLGDYKKIASEAKDKQKKGGIWVPGQEEKAPTEAEEKAKQELLNQILERLITETKIEISDLIIQDELNHRLAALLDDIQKIGLSVESYLKSKGTTLEEIKERYMKEIEEIHKTEFALQEIADKEGIKVEQKELEQLFEKIADPKERSLAAQNAYFYAALLRKQKTLDFLATL